MWKGTIQYGDKFMTWDGVAWKEEPAAKRSIDPNKPRVSFDQLAEAKRH